MANSQNKTVLSADVPETDAEVDAILDAVEEKTSEGKRGRNPLTHSDVMARIVAPNPVDVSFSEFSHSKFAAIDVVVNAVFPDKNETPNAETLKAITAALTVGGILGRWSTVVKWWNESDELKTAKDAITAWQAEQEMAAKVAKLTKTERAEFDAAPESVKAMILRFISL